MTNVGGRSQGLSMELRWLFTFLSRATVLVVAYVFLFGALLALLTLLPRPHAQVILYALVAVVVAVVLATVLVGAVVTAVLPPLRPVSETSILGRRVVTLARWGLGAAALFSGAYVSWMVAATYDAAKDDPELFTEATSLLANVLWGALGVASLITCIWLSIDLLRVGKRRRSNAVDVIARRTGRLLGVDTNWIRRMARLLMASRVWILIAFYMLPVAIVAAVELGSAGVRAMAP